MVYNNLAIPTTFIISHVNRAILGLDTIPQNGLQLTVEGYKGYLGNDQTEVKLHYIGNQFYLKATMFDGFYNYVDYTRNFASWYRQRRISPIVVEMTDDTKTENRGPLR
eukprot:1308799-Amphidinium_carterae.1